jgi:hypothetical protein
MSTAAKGLEILTGPDNGTLTKLQRMAIDLANIGFQIGENITKFPRTLHTSLSLRFPQECLIARNTPPRRTKILTSIFPDTNITRVVVPESLSESTSSVFLFVHKLRYVLGGSI